MDVMLDLETLDVRPGGVIASIGACTMKLADGNWWIPKTFCMNVALQPQFDRGMSVSEDTLRWWFAPELAEARASLLDQPAVAPQQAFAQFRQWMELVKGETLWAHGESFDVPILEEAMRVFNVKPSWSYRAGRDTRTLFDLVGKKMGDFGTPAYNPKHNALSDALWQAAEVRAAYAYLREKGLEVPHVP